MAEPYLHFSFAKGFNHWIEKHNQYSSDEAHSLWAELSGGGSPRPRGLFARDPVQRRRAAKALASRLPCRAPLRFLYAYILRLGFLDGRPGLTYCALLAVYEYMISVKLSELRRME